MTTVATADIKITADGASAATGQLKQVSSSLSGLSNAGAIAGAALKTVFSAAAISAAVKFGAQLIQVGVASNRAENALGALSAGRVDEYIEAIGDATNHTMSRMDAMSVSSKFLSMGLADNATEAAELSRVAAILGGTFQGLNAGDAAQQFAIMLANMSVERLDTFGISSAQVRKRIEELQAATPGLTREMAFLQATMEIGTATANQFGDVLDDVGGSVAQAQADIADAGAAIGEALAIAFQPLTDIAVTAAQDASDVTTGILGISDAMRAQRREWIQNTSSFQEFHLEQARYLRTLSLTDKVLLAVTGQIVNSRVRYDAIAASIRQADMEMKKASQTTVTFGNALQDAAAGAVAASLALSPLQNMTLEFGLGGIPEIEGFFQTIAQSPGMLGLSSNEIMELGTALGLISPQAATAAQAWQWMTDNLGDFNLTADQTAELIRNVADGMGQAELETKALGMAAANTKQRVIDMADEAQARVQELAETPADITIETNGAQAAGEIQKVAGELRALPKVTPVKITGNFLDAYKQAASVRAMLGSISGTYHANISVGVSGMPAGVTPGPGGAVVPQASGGVLSAGQVSLVGEQGPEIFVPSSSGYIVPNNVSFGATGFGAGGGGGGLIEITIPILLDGREVGRGAFAGTLDQLQSAGVIRGGMVA